MMLAILLVHYKRKSEKKSSEMNKLERSSSESLKVSYRDLYQATNGFSSSNLIGSGNFGSVYEGFLDQVKRTVAVKVLKFEKNGCSYMCDFGLARFLSTSYDSSQTRFSITGIKGTIGYAAPEYGMGSEASKMGDVYSYMGSSR